LKKKILESAHYGDSISVVNTCSCDWSERKHGWEVEHLRQNPIASMDVLALVIDIGIVSTHVNAEPVRFTELMRHSEHPKSKV